MDENPDYILKGENIMSEIYTELIDEIHSSLEQLSTMDPSDKGYMENVKSLEILWKLKQEEDKIGIKKEECKIEHNKLSAEKEKIGLKKSEDAAEETKSLRSDILQAVGLGVQVMSIVLPLMFYGEWISTGLKFEETGTFTSNTFKGLTKFIKPTK